MGARSAEIFSRAAHRRGCAPPHCRLCRRARCEPGAGALRAAGRLCPERSCARCAVQADSGAQFRWRLRIAAAGSAPARAGGSGREHAAAVSGGVVDRCRSARGQPGVCRCRAPASAEPHCVPRDRHLVVAAGTARGRSRAAGSATRHTAGNEKAIGRGAPATVVGHRQYARAARVRAMVVALRRRPLPARAVRPEQRRC
jgi:hypothetical protein